jgi:hypothetical protein
MVLIRPNGEPVENVLRGALIQNWAHGAVVPVQSQVQLTVLVDAARAARSARR